MKRSERMAIIEKLAKQREDQASTALIQLRDHLQKEQTQLTELEGYRHEYQQNLQQNGQTSISILQWQRTQTFINQLDRLIEQQESVIIRWQQQEARLVQQWQKLYQRRKSLSQLVDKIGLEELVAADKQEQKMLDELVNQMQGRLK